MSSHNEVDCQLCDKAAVYCLVSFQGDYGINVCSHCYSGEVVETLNALFDEYSLRKPKPRTIEELTGCDGYDMWRDSHTGNDMWMSNPERKERIEREASEGGEGSTHREILEDWREYLDIIEHMPESFKIDLRYQIDKCDKDLTNKGWIDNIIG